VTTGWPPGLLQDDERKLSRWLATRPDALYQLRKNMTKDDIIRMAREAGAWSQQFKNRDVEYVMSAESLERFAALVFKEAERKASFDKAELWLKRINEAVLAEREACAKLAWTTPEPEDEYVPLRMAISDAIRARGQAS
jgi:hypothetical protein